MGSKKLSHKLQIFAKIEESTKSVKFMIYEVYDIQRESYLIFA